MSVFDQLCEVLACVRAVVIFYQSERVKNCTLKIASNNNEKWITYVVSSYLFKVQVCVIENLHS